MRAHVTRAARSARPRGAAPCARAGSRRRRPRRSRRRRARARTPPIPRAPSPAPSTRSTSSVRLDDEVHAVEQPCRLGELAVLVRRTTRETAERAAAARADSSGAGWAPSIRALSTKIPAATNSAVATAMAALRCERRGAAPPSSGRSSSEPNIGPLLEHTYANTQNRPRLDRPRLRVAGAPALAALAVCAASRRPCCSCAVLLVRVAGEAVGMAVGRASCARGARPGRAADGLSRRARR